MLQEPQFFLYGIIEFIIKYHEISGSRGPLSKPFISWEGHILKGLFVAGLPPWVNFDAGPWILRILGFSGPPPQDAVGFLRFFLPWKSHKNHGFFVPYLEKIEIEGATLKLG